MKQFTAHDLITSVTAHEGNIAVAVGAWLCAVESPQRVRMEIILDAARGLFSQRSERPEAAAWATGLCAYAASKTQSFEPKWKALALEVELHLQSGKHAAAAEVIERLSEYSSAGTYGYEVGFVCDRLRQSLHPHPGRNP